MRDAANDHTDAGELRSLADFGINGLNVNHTIIPEQQNGNWLLERGTVTFNDGHTAEMADAYFEIDPNTVGAPDLRKSDELKQLNLGVPTDDTLIRNKLGPAAEQFFAERKLYAPVIDWNSNTTSFSPSDNETAKKKIKAKSSWLGDFLGIDKPLVNLSGSTGLNVTMPKTEQPEQPFVERRQSVRVDMDGTKLRNER